METVLPREQLHLFSKLFLGADQRVMIHLSRLIEASMQATRPVLTQHGSKLRLSFLQQERVVELESLVLHKTYQRTKAFEFAL
jgi:hypothetical protein